MAINNEIVRFIAKVDFDQDTSKKFEQGLSKSEQHCEDLRKEIDKTVESISGMRSRGEDNSTAFKEQSKHLKELQNSYKNAQKEVQKYGLALDTNRMSMQDLRIYTKQLRSTLDGLHKEANPKLWNKYNAELKNAYKRMDDLKKGSTTMRDKITSFSNKYFTSINLGLSLFAGAVSLVKKGISHLIENTQLFGDAWQSTMAGFSAGWHQFLVNIASGKNVIKGSVAEAFKEGKRIAELEDEQFERNNSLLLLKTEADAYIKQQETIALDSSRGAREREEALNNILKKEEEIRKIEYDINKDNLEAATTKLKLQTKLSEENLVKVVDQYEQNRPILKQAKEYNDLLKEESRLEKAKKTAQFNKAYADSDDGIIKLFNKDYKNIEEGIDEELKKIQELKKTYNTEIQSFAAILRQYDLSSDAVVKDYIDAKNKQKKLDVDAAAVKKNQQRRRSQLKKQMATEAAQEQEKEYNDKITQAEDAYKRELLQLKNDLQEKRISEAEYQSKSYAAEEVMLLNKLSINKAYGKSTLELDTIIAERRIAISKGIETALLKTDSEFVKMVAKNTNDAELELQKSITEFASEIMSDVVAITEEDTNYITSLAEKASNGFQSKSGKIAQETNNYNVELKAIEEMHKLALISEEEYLSRKKVLNEEHAKTIAQIQVESVANTTAVAQSYIGAIGNAVNAVRDAEYATLEAEKEKELSLVGDNAEKREEIENEYEAKKLDIQKKYADIDMGINIAKAIAAGAVAAIQAYAQLGPIAGGVMAGVIAATTAAQVATIVAQRNAIQNSSPSSKNAGSTKVRELTGFSDGGYTGDGDRMEVAGVVHKGEYVVPAPLLRNPDIARQIAQIEQYRQMKTMSNRLSGFADGGYAAEQIGGESSKLLKAIYEELNLINKAPIPAYVVLSELQAKQELQSKFKERTSLNQSR